MLKTEFLGLNYHPNPATNTDEVDAEKYFNENYFTIDANAKKNYEDLTKLKEDLQQENTELAGNMPWNTVAGKSLYITDSAKYSKNRLEISGDLEQEKRSGYNLFDYINKVKKGTNYGVTITTDDEGYIIANGTIQDSYKSLVEAYSIDNILENAETYTVWQEKHSSGLDGIYVQLKLVNKSTQAETFVYASSVNRKVVVDKNTYNYYINIQWATAEQVFSNYKNRYMLLKGDYTTTATEFEKYGATPSTEFPSMPLTATGVQKIRQFGENLFDVNDKINTYTVDKDDWVTVSATNSNTVNEIYTNVYTKASKNIRQNTNYSVILEIKSISGEGVIRPMSNSATSSPSQFAGNLAYNFANLHAGDIKIDTITSKSDFTNCIVMLRTFIAVPPGKSGSITFRLSVLEDTNITVNNFVYEPYWGKVHTLNLGTTEICAIKENGNVVAQDRAVHRNGKWQWEKNVGKKVLNGTENWLMVSTNTSTNKRFNINNVFADAQPAKSITVLQECACDKLKTITANETFYNVEGFAFSTLDSATNCVHAFIYTEQTKNMSVAEFKSWLSNNNITVYYILRTPIYTDCTAEQSTVLDKLYNNFALQKGTNNIIVETDNGVGVNMDLTYMQDLQAKLNLLEAMCVSNASQEV